MSKFGSFVDYVQLTATDWDTFSVIVSLPHLKKMLQFNDN